MGSLLGLCYICGKISSRNCKMCGQPICEKHAIGEICINCARGKMLRQV